ncbi:Tab2 family RNA-binding protein [Spirulina sp. CCNP1310]|uniref:Tab2 family RNA-binding protein n=1 Tax=Spirulina sp. CCNP1310 TaxID=3110249 RepID=UPI002B21138E|nr:Tab2 family RNA-binding protein [Spirulina sp. CCNP1310]MEA5418019.1 Tab2 family RNA-binding protein [Spirulina sp. CCNP1310]
MLDNWQGDLYRHPTEQNRWYFCLCNATGTIAIDATIEQSALNAPWLTAQLQQADITGTLALFRPEALGLLTTAAQPLNLNVIPTRHTPAIKAHLAQRFGPSLLQIPSPPPQAIPEQLWGEQWRFASFPAGDWELWRDRPIPYRHIARDPLAQGLSITTPIPGVVVYGGRRSRSLAQWLDQVQPFALHYIPTEVGESGGLILEAGLSDRFVFVTFADGEMAQGAAHYEQQRQTSHGLHFLLIQPDDSAITFTGFWLLADH